VYMTLWDGGGNDTYDLSNYANGMQVDIKPGRWTTMSVVQAANLGEGYYARGNVANALLYEGDTRSLIENVIGGAGNDFIYGNEADNRLEGGAGNDYLDGDFGNDRLMLQGGGWDTARGGPGADIIYFGATFDGNDAAHGDGGADVLVLQGNYPSLSLDELSLVEVETLSLLSGKDARFGDFSGGSYDYDITTSISNVPYGERLTVNAALLTLGEDFTFNGSAELDGRFLIYAGQGQDRLTGGAGVDWFFFGESGRYAAGDTVDGGGDSDNLIIRGNYTGANAITFAANSFDNVETLTLMTGTDLRFAGGGVNYAYDITLVDGNVRAGQTLTINGGQLTSTEVMTLDTSAETDGHFRIFGSAGQDFILAGQGNDLIYGGRGKDELTGNGGNDTFRFDDVWGEAESAVGNADKILDFTSGQDLIDLALIDANSTIAGDQAFTFKADGLFTGAGQLRVLSSGNGSWFVEGDINGDGAADFQIEVFSPVVLTPTDFLM
jgi:serralysin